MEHEYRSSFLRVIARHRLGAAFLTVIKVGVILVASIIVAAVSTSFTSSGFPGVGLVILLALMTMAIPWVRTKCLGSLPHWVGFVQFFLGLIMLVPSDNEMKSPAHLAMLLAQERAGAIASHDASAYLDHLAKTHGHDHYWMSEVSAVDPARYPREVGLRQAEATEAANVAARKAAAEEEARKQAEIVEAQRLKDREKEGQRAEIVEAQRLKDKEKERQAEIVTLKAVPKRQLDRDPAKAAEVYGRLAEIDSGNPAWKGLAAAAQQKIARAQSVQTKRRPGEPNIMEYAVYQVSCENPRDFDSGEGKKSFLPWRTWSSQAKAGFTCAATVKLNPELDPVHRIGRAYGLETCMNGITERPETGSAAEWDARLRVMSINEVISACSVLMGPPKE